VTHPTPAGPDVRRAAQSPPAPHRTAPRRGLPPLPPQGLPDRRLPREACPLPPLGIKLLLFYFIF